MRGFLLGIAVSILILFSAFGGAIADRLFGVKPLDYFFGKNQTGVVSNTEKIVEVSGDVTLVVDKASPGVVTVAIEAEQSVAQPLIVDIFGNVLNNGSGKTEQVKRDIGSGFVVDGGLVVTNKHVVSNTLAKYKVVDKDDNEYEVSDVYRDPVNDLAILKIKDGNLPALDLGDSNNLKVGQSVIAIGTALGEFRHTVTTGVISGLGRGITAGDGRYSSEQLDNIIQTDAAINPGNSGGPLLNSAGYVVGVNVAVANANNIGFAIPINVVAESLANFKATGEFSRAYLGVSYRMLDKQTALLNDVPEGAYVVEVNKDSVAESVGLAAGDILVSIDGVKIADIDGGLAGAIGRKKIGDKAKISYWRDGKMAETEVTFKKQ
jgi:serine protease Do